MSSIRTASRKYSMAIWWKVHRSLRCQKKPSIKDPAQFKIVGTGKGHWDAPQIVSGKAIYGLDVRLPDMLFAVIARCPVFRWEDCQF